MERRLQRSEPDCSRGLTDFWRSVAEAVCWCLPRATLSRPEDCLRHEDFRPYLFENSRFQTVGGVVTQRSHRVRKADVDALLAAGEVLSGGRLLVFYPEGTLSDGAAQAQTRGFFDVHNVPPWDTWVGLFSDDRDSTPGLGTDYLVSWVPPEMVRLVSDGLWVNPEQCIEWLDDSNTGLARLLRGG